MTDNDIKKSIEWHLNSETNCDECSYKDFKKTNGNCVGKMLKDALNLINRLEEKDKKNENIIRLADKTIEKQSAEIERLKVERDKEHDYCNHYVRMCAKAKSEAIKEFAERLTDKADLVKANAFDSRWAIWQDDIDNLVKEMTEENENGKV